MHWYESVRADFYEQMLSEIKIPSRTNPKRRVWKARTDRHNESLDCTVYAVYLCRHLRLHLKRPAQWDLAEMALRQKTLIAGVDDPAADGVPAAHPAPEPEAVPSKPEIPEIPETPDVPALAARARERLNEMLRQRRQNRHGG
jgi:phage terminase large subunit GpA-like protein